MQWLLVTVAAGIALVWTAHFAIRRRQSDVKSSAEILDPKPCVMVPECDSGEEWEESCAILDPASKKQAAIAFLRDWLHPSETAKIRTLIQRHGQHEWIWHLYDEDIADLYPQEKRYAARLSPHFGFGMQVRNALRRAGFGEEELGVRNLQDVYLDLLEAGVEDKRSSATQPDEDTARQPS